ncbi:MAG: hypothetical protein ACKOW5_02410 [Actinomycetales bacterium]
MPTGALLKPTLVITGRSAAQVYAQPAAELKRLTDAGATIKIARGFYAAVPIGKESASWLPSIEDLAAGLASAVYGPGKGVLWGLSAARVHGALARAIATAHAFGPTQHRPVALVPRPGQVQFRKRNPQRLDIDYFDTELGPGLVTSVAQTILDLSTREFEGDADLRMEAVRNLMNVVDLEELSEVATRVRGLAAMKRARAVASHAQ